MKEIISNHKEWINCSKFVAIFAVIIDHTNGFLYQSQTIAKASYFSVTLFILLSGVTLFYQNDKMKDIGYFQKIGKFLKKILTSYAVAVLIVYIYIYNNFDLLKYIESLKNFKIQGPYYFVLFYVQLVLISPVIYTLTSAILHSKYKKIFFSITLAALLAASAVLISKTFIMNVHGGGKHLFGGSYLAIFFVGMFLVNTNLYTQNNVINLRNIMLLALAWFGWLIFFSKNNFSLDLSIPLSPFGRGFNPPGLTLGIFAIITFFLLQIIFETLSKSENRFSQKAVKVIDYLGSQSLYIFLYHLIAIDLSKKIIARLEISDQFLKIAITLSLAIAIPIMIKIIFDKITKNYLKLKSKTFDNPEISRP